MQQPAAIVKYVQQTGCGAQDSGCHIKQHVATHMLQTADEERN
jgi:hypothetical protein